METTLHQRWPGLEPPAISLKNPDVTRWLRRLWRRQRLNIAVFGLFALFLHIGPLLRLADPTAAVVDAGALSLVLLAVVALAAFLAVSRWLIGLLWPVMRGYQQNQFSNNFKSLSPWQKITFYLVIFFGLLYAFVCCLVAVFLSSVFHAAKTPRKPLCDSCAFTRENEKRNLQSKLECR